MATIKLLRYMASICIFDIIIYQSTFLINIFNQIT